MDDELSSTIDELFWKRVCESNGLRVHCKSTGSKPALLELAQELQDNPIQNIIVALDADYDTLLDRKINHHQIFYTYGYSWESDAVLELNADHVINLFYTSADTTAAAQELNDFLDAISFRLKRFCAIDARYYSCPTALFARSKSTSLLLLPPGAAPSLNLKTVVEKARTITHFEAIRIPEAHWESVPPLAQVFGKLSAKLVYHWICAKAS